YTIEKELTASLKTIDNMHVAMVGDLKHGRTVHSLSKLLAQYKNITFSLISPKALAMPDEIVSTLENAGHKVIITDSIEGNVDANILYLTRIQEERFTSQEEADLYRGQFRLNQQIYTKHCKSNTVIMHPLPRDSRSDANELDTDLNLNPNLAIFRQVENGVLIRMALFALTLGVSDQMSKHESDVHWFSRK
ncbi:MAG: aspartate carbamoyltransferase, partial [Psychrobium sp.]